MKKLLPILLALLALAGCKPDEIIIRQTEVQRVTDTLHQYSVLRDSIYFRDSIFMERFVLPAARDSNPEARDTLRETKFVYRYLYKEKKGKDSVRVINRTDTILIQKTDLRAIELAEANAAEAETKFKLWRLYFWLLLGGILISLGFIIYKKLKS